MITTTTTTTTETDQSATGPTLARTSAGVGDSSARPSGHGAVVGAERERLAATFGARLRQARRAAGMTQADLAIRAAVVAPTVSQLETGKRRPGASTLAALAAVLAPDAPQSLAAELRALAGDSVRPGWARKIDRIPSARQVRAAEMALTAARRRTAMFAERDESNPSPENTRRYMFALTIQEDARQAVTELRASRAPATH